MLTEWIGNGFIPQVALELAVKEVKEDERDILIKEYHEMNGVFPLDFMVCKDHEKVYVMSRYSLVS